MILAGWNCATCLVFNGEEKEPRDSCRSCGAARRTLGLDLEAHMRRMRVMEENLTSTQEASTRLQLERQKLAILRTETLAFIRRFGNEDGAHHKQWALDQVVRMLKQVVRMLLRSTSAGSLKRKTVKRVPRRTTGTKGSRRDVSRG